MSASVLAHLDPALPRLADCLSADRVATMFGDRWPGPGGPVEVLGCVRHDVRYQPGASCQSAWLLEVSRNDATWRTIGVVETEGTSFGHRLYLHDSALPGLAGALDTESMAGRLGAVVEGVSDAWTVTPVRYRPGQRAVLRYASNLDGRAVTLFAKICADGVDEIGSIMAALHAAAKRAPAMPEVPHPFAVFTDLGMVVQPLAHGEALKDLLFDASSQAPPGDRLRSQLEALRETGAILAAFHSCGVEGRRRRRLVDDLAAVRRSIPIVAGLRPELAGRLDRALDPLFDIAMSETGDFVDPVPSHGSFRADHVMLCTGRGSVIDVDGFCQAEPARDAASLLAYLRWKSIREPRHASMVDASRSALLDGYQRDNAHIDPLRCRAYEAAGLLRIAAGRYRNLMVEEWPLVPQLVDAATALCGST